MADFRIRVAPFDTPVEAFDMGLTDVFSLVVRNVNDINDIKVSGIAPGYQYVIEDY